MSFPETWLTEISQSVAVWLLAAHSGETVPTEVASFLSHLRGDAANAAAQNALFGIGPEGEDRGYLGDEFAHLA